MSIEVMGGGGGYPEYVQEAASGIPQITASTTSIKLGYNRFPQYIDYLELNVVGTDSSRTNELWLVIGGHSFYGTVKRDYTNLDCRIKIRSVEPQNGYYVGMCDILINPDTRNITFYNIRYLGGNNITLPLGSYSTGNYVYSNIHGHNN